MPVFLVRKCLLLHSVSDRDGSGCVVGCQFDHTDETGAIVMLPVTEGEAGSNANRLKNNGAHPDSLTYASHLKSNIRGGGYKAETFDYGILYEQGLSNLVKRATRAGLKVPKEVELNERGRGYTEGVSRTKLNRLVYEGQDSSLEGHEARRANTASKTTAFLGRDPKGIKREAKGYIPLKGESPRVN